jgi:hypothetical protein
MSRQKHVGKSKHVLRKRGLTIPRQKSNDMFSLSSLECTCRKFSKQPRENLGIEKKCSFACTRYDNIKDAMQVYLTCTRI